MCFGASVLLRKASALKRIDVRYGPQNAHFHFVNVFAKYALQSKIKTVKLSTPFLSFVFFSVRIRRIT